MLQAYLSSSPTTSTSEPACNHAHSRQEDSSNPTLLFHWKRLATVQLALVGSCCYDRRNEKAGLPLTVSGILVLCSNGSME